MARQIINTGTSELAGDGESIRSAFVKVNSNFLELYTTGGPLGYTGSQGVAGFVGSTGFVGSAGSPGTVGFTGSQGPSNFTNIASHVLPAANLTYDLGSTSTQWRSLYVGTNTIYLGQTALSVSSGKLTLNGNLVSGNILSSGTNSLIFQEDALRLDWRQNSVNRARIQINDTSTFLIASLLGDVVIAAADGSGEWSFKTNGDLYSAGGKFASVAETDLLLVSSNSPLGDAGDVRLAAGIGSGNNGEVYITTSDIYDWHFDNGGALTLPQVQSLTNQAILRSDGDIIIATTSSGSWRFGSDNQLVLPNSVVLKDNALGSIGLGYNAGQNNQNGPNIAIGTTAGENNQAAGAVAIGYRAGRNTQGAGAVALGINAGVINQGAYAVAIGTNAGYTNQTTGSIVINASSSVLNGSESGLYINPIRSDASSNATDFALFYNPVTKEVTTSSLTHIKVPIDEVFTITTSFSVLGSPPAGPTSFDWQFYPDGFLILPAGGGISTQLDENFIINVNATVMTSPPGPVSVEYIFNSSGQLEFPSTNFGLTPGITTLGYTFDINANGSIWRFDDGSRLTFPDNTIQETAYQKTTSTFNATSPTVDVDNFRAQIDGSGNPAVGAVFSNFTCAYTLNRTLFTGGTWNVSAVGSTTTNFTTSFASGLGTTFTTVGDQVVGTFQDLTFNRIYKVTWIKSAAGANGNIIVERLM